MEKPPVELLPWVKQQLAGESPSESAFNWHGLAFHASMKARELDDASPVWAEISVVAYAWLADRSRGSIAASFTLSEMYVRAHRISVDGPRAGHPVRDVQTLLAWFYDGLDLAFCEARGKADNWPSLPLSEIAGLRSIKKKLGVIEMLVNKLSPVEHSKVQCWLALRSRLP